MFSYEVFKRHVGVLVRSVATTRGPHVLVTDDRFEYGEARTLAFGLIGGRLFVCVFADRDSERRVISLRKANSREVRRYGDPPE